MGAVTFVLGVLFGSAALTVVVVFVYSVIDYRRRRRFSKKRILEELNRNLKKKRTP